jgi:hypothetical protein
VDQSRRYVNPERYSRLPDGCLARRDERIPGNYEGLSKTEARIDTGQSKWEPKLRVLKEIKATESEAVAEHPGD